MIGAVTGLPALAAVRHRRFPKYRASVANPVEA